MSNVISIKDHRLKSLDKLQLLDAMLTWQMSNEKYTPKSIQTATTIFTLLLNKAETPEMKRLCTSQIAHLKAVQLSKA